MKAIAYVDGSYNAAAQVYGAGAVLFLDDCQKPICLSQPGNHPAFVRSRNVAGEVMAAMAVVEACKKVVYLEELTLYYDYSGIECWAKGTWAARSILAAVYKESLKDLPFRLSFRKVKAHSGDKYNDMADWLAKQACGLSCN